MRLAVKKGRAKHEAGNIKDSGKALEDEFRAMLSESLPSTSKVATGYFYDAYSECSNEVDVLIYEAHEAFRLDPSKGEQAYLPYTSVSIIGQIKHSSRELSGAIAQINTSMNTWFSMRQRVSKIFGTEPGPLQRKPLTFIVCGESRDCDLEKLESTLSADKGRYVDYILFLDRAEIVASASGLFDATDQHINFCQYESRGALHLCSPKVTDEDPSGIALLWLYFALIDKLNSDKGENLRYSLFCRQIEVLYPLHVIRRLSQ